MNVHDSERMAGLLEQAGYRGDDEAADADVVVINTCSVRERAEDKLYTRLGELRVMAAEQGARSDRRGRRLRRAAGRREHPEALARRRRRHRRHAGDPPAADDGRAGGADRRPVINLDPFDDVTFPLGVTRRTDPVKAYVTIIEGCNEFCSFCVVPYTRGNERMRPKADILAEVGRRRRGPREVQLLGQIVNHYAAPDDPRLRLQRPARGGSRRRRHRADPVRQPAPAPRVGALYRDDGAAAEDLPSSAFAGAVGIDRVLDTMRRRYTRESYLDLIAQIRESLPDVACRPI
jgi:tRNA-2-methylthio-N6-dimethylallyladenosine synthase